MQSTKEKKVISGWWAEVVGIALFPQIITILFQIVICGSIKSIDWSGLIIHGELVLTASIVSLTSAMHGYQYKKALYGGSFYFALFCAAVFVGLFALIKAIPEISIVSIIFMSVTCPISSFVVSFSLETQIRMED